MDWNNELYVKLYRRETADDLLLSWEARALWHEMLKKFDRSGIIKARRGARGLAALVKMPDAVVENALAELVEDGRVQSTDGGWVAPNFTAAQEASKSNALRQKEVRDKRRQQAISHLSNGASRESNGESQLVTDSHSDQIRSDQIRSDLIRSELNRSDPKRACARDLLFPAEWERRRVPEDPSRFMVIDLNGDYHALVQILEDGSEEIAG